MKARISTLIATNENRMWDELQKTASLMQVASPILIFESRHGRELPAKWEVEKQYKFRIFAFGFVPLGMHDIIVKRIDRAKKEIFTNESSFLSRTWDHLLRVEKINEKFVRYSDEVEIRAGVLTLFIWLFAHVFYRHRQKKWKVLLAGGSSHTI